MHQARKIWLPDICLFYSVVNFGMVICSVPFLLPNFVTEAFFIRDYFVESFDC